MSESRMHVRLPALPQLEVLTDPLRTIRTDSGDALLTYDPSTHAAMIYNVRLQRWSITSPIDFETFFTMCAASGFAVANTDDAKRWVEANASVPGPATARH